MRHNISEPDPSGIGETAGLKVELDEEVMPSKETLVLISNYWTTGSREPVYVNPDNIESLIESLKEAKEKAEEVNSE